MLLSSFELIKFDFTFFATIINFILLGGLLYLAFLGIKALRKYIVQQDDNS